MGGFVVGVRLMAGPGALPEFSRRNLVGDLHLVPTRVIASGYYRVKVSEHPTCDAIVT